MRVGMAATIPLDTRAGPPDDAGVPSRFRTDVLSQPDHACLLIADISGYTGYLAGVELDHAHDILADVVDTVVTSLRPAFRLAKLEGDAAFAYAMAAGLDRAARDVARRAAGRGYRQPLRPWS